MKKPKRMKTRKRRLFSSSELTVALKEQVQNIGKEKILIMRIRSESQDHRYDHRFLSVPEGKLKRAGNHGLFQR